MENTPKIRPENTGRSVVTGITSIVLFSDSIDNAMAVLRILGPADAAGIKVIRGWENEILYIDRIAEGDIVVLQREFPRHLDGYKKIITEARNAHKPVIYDLDDLLFELPANHPDRLSQYFADALLPMLQAAMEADLVVVATPALHDYLLPLNQNIEIFPNYLNDKLWSLKPPANNPLPNNSINIGYMGGHSHKPDLMEILPALINIEKKYHPRMKFHFWGIEAPRELVPYSQVDWCPPKSYSYIDFAEYFQTQTADIMIAPLQDTEFNRCKSAIKHLEYGALGTAGVYSKLTPYERIIEDGMNGLLASTQTEWEDALSRLIDDPELRLKITHNAQVQIKNHWLLSQNASSFIEIYEKSFSNLPANATRSAEFFQIIESLASQVFENNQTKNQIITKNSSLINSQRAKLSEYEVLIEQLRDENNMLAARDSELQEEILGYALSTSWKITRPLRKISANISKAAH